MRDALREFGRIRFVNRIAEQADWNLEWLEGDGWIELESSLASLADADDPASERWAARFVAKSLKGFGPKQSRNFIQLLGLSRHEIPLDSRIVRWLNSHGFPINLSAAGLADLDYYEFVLDGVQELCRAADILPCVFDACVFASFDRGDWSQVRQIW